LEVNTRDLEVIEPIIN